jgi:hypothetical protein
VYACARHGLKAHATHAIETAMWSEDAQWHGLHSQGSEEWSLSEPRRAIHGPEDGRGSAALSMRFIVVAGGRPVRGADQLRRRGVGPPPRVGRHGASLGAKHNVRRHADFRHATATSSCAMSPSSFCDIPSLGPASSAASSASCSATTSSRALRTTSAASGGIDAEHLERARNVIDAGGI